VIKGMAFFMALFLTALCSAPSMAGARVSDRTQECLECHTAIHPGIVRAWERSRMARMTPAGAVALPEEERRVSFKGVPEALGRVVVGCAECHTLHPETHKDTFEHNGHRVHVVVTPTDCATCHPVEMSQFRENLMSRAYGNLRENSIYRSLSDSVNGPHTLKGVEIVTGRPDLGTEADSCLYCHGTKVLVEGKETRETEMGEMTFPVLQGWPSQGVGRVNPDGSKGACSACHTRHTFSIEMARKPHTCSECHKGPDVPAYKVYNVSKHGNTYCALGKTWNFDAVPWVVGRDFTAPTCAACHVSGIADEDGNVIAGRTHRMNDRLAWRILGLIYAHPQPRSPDTTVLRNRLDLPLPTELTGEPVSKGLIDTRTMEARQERMERICLSCHATGWVKGHFARLENTIRTTNEMTRTATRILMNAWEEGAAGGLAQGDGIFNEVIEKKWVEQWLFFANSTRYASAMAGADYGVFSGGRWHLSRNIHEMMERFNDLMEQKE